jgi:hypothetical protein
MAGDVYHRPDPTTDCPEVKIAPPSGGNATLREERRAVLAFLHWLKAEAGGEIWTPDSWARSGMSPDNWPLHARVDQFLRETAKNG